MAPVQRSIFEYFQDFAGARGEELFLFDENRRYTVQETFGEAIAIANRLYDCGVGRGSLVALRSTRSLDAYLIYLAIEFMGATAVLTNPHQDAETFLRDTGLPITPDLTVTNEKAAGGISAVGNWEIPGHGDLVIHHPGRVEEPRFPVGTDIHSPATMVFTSGSTGKSKATVLSQEAMLQYAEDSIVQPWHLPGDIAIVTLPTQHAFSLCLLITAFVARYALFFPRSLDAEYVLDCIPQYQITRINGVPSYMYVLARANAQNPRDLRSLRTGFTAGSPVIPEQHRFIEQSLGMALHPLYGMSESISISCTAPTDDPEHRATTVGKFHRHAGCILDPQGRELPTGAVGEVCVSGPALFLGYYADEEATRKSIDEEGRLHTGDLGFVDDQGYLHLTGRIKSVIIRNGINLSPAKIEAAIRSVPGVENAMVVGIRHELMGEAPCALVIPRPGVTMTAAQLTEALSTRLLKNEIPIAFLFDQTIPLNDIGKPDKKQVQDLFRHWRTYDTH